MNTETDFIIYLKTLKPEDWNKKVSKTWIVKDVVAHMIGWEKESANVIKQIWESKELPWFMTSEDYDDFNHKAVEFYKDYTPKDLIEEWEMWQEKTQKEIDHIGEDKLKAHPDLFGWLFEEGEGSHYRHHLSQIKKILNPK